MIKVSNVTYIFGSELLHLSALSSISSALLFTKLRQYHKVNHNKKAALWQQKCLAYEHVLEVCAKGLHYSNK